MTTDPLPLKRIKLSGSSESSLISPRKRYKVKIEGEWHEGQFSKQWFGWQFDGVQPGVQLNLIDEVFEIQNAPGDRGNRKSGKKP